MIIIFYSQTKWCVHNYSKLMNFYRNISSETDASVKKWERFWWRRHFSFKTAMPGNGASHLSIRPLLRVTSTKKQSFVHITSTCKMGICMDFSPRDISVFSDGHRACSWRREMSISAVRNTSIRISLVFLFFGKRNLKNGLGLSRIFIIDDDTVTFSSLFTEHIQ